MPSPRPPVQIVWLKRDLRVFDHAPLAQAARRGRVLPLYIAEPGLWAQPDASARHWDFIRECLGELRADLADLGATLVIRVGEAVDVLSGLLEHLPVAAVWSHEETGNGWTYDRDKAVARLLRARGVPWHELPQHGVVRRLASRDRWSREWERRTAQGLTPAPPLRPAMPSLEPGEIPEGRALGLADDPCPLRQAGGRSAAVAALEGFLTLKVCARCGLQFTWRRRWARCWDAVRYCSERCRRGR
jgi:deoxyribodipyrimidine photo-lyase